MIMIVRQMAHVKQENENAPKNGPIGENHGKSWDMAAQMNIGDKIWH